MVINDDRVVAVLIEHLLDRSGLTQSEICARLGIKLTSLNQYRTLRRKRPSIQWLAKLAAACGGRVELVLPVKQP